jgi:trigger factor
MMKSSFGPRFWAGMQESVGGAMNTHLETSGDRPRCSLNER